jgi:hypothetical protein
MILKIALIVIEKRLLLETNICGACRKVRRDVQAGLRENLKNPKRLLF